MILGLAPDDAADDRRGTGATRLTLDRGTGGDGPGRDDAGLAAAT